MFATFGSFCVCVFLNVPLINLLYMKWNIVSEKKQNKTKKKISIGQILIRLVNFNTRKLLLSLVVSGGVSREGAA